MNQIFVVEKKEDGVRATIHRKGDSIRLFCAAGDDITDRYPSLVKSSKELTKHDFIIDGVISYDLESSTVTFNAFDILYLTDSLIELPWYDRKKNLHTLKFNERIKEIYSIIIDTHAELSKAVGIVTNLPSSKGAVVKTYESLYHTGKQTTEWRVLDG